MYNLLKDVSTLSQIPEKVLMKLQEIANICISDYVTEKVVENTFTGTLDVDIGIGTLFLHFTGNELTYTFKPSAELEKIIVKAYNGEEVLKNTVSSRLENQVYKTYKEML